MFNKILRIRKRMGNNNFIQKERVAVIFITGFMQFENKQKLKGILLIAGLLLFIVLAFLTRNTAYSIFLGYVYGFGVLDSFSIAIENKEKRVSISDSASKLVDKPDELTYKPKKADSFEKGEIFENFVKNKFNKRDFTIVKQTVPFPRSNGFLVDSLTIENNLDPDFILRYRPNHEKFALETKWRSFLGNYDLIYPEQMARYKQFEEDEKIPVFIVIGIGGTANKPNRLFLLPLNKADSHELSLEFLSKYEVDPKNNFKWRPGCVWNPGYLYQSSD